MGQFCIKTKQLFFGTNALLFSLPISFSAARCGGWVSSRGKEGRKEEANSSACPNRQKKKKREQKKAIADNSNNNTLSLAAAAAAFTKEDCNANISDDDGEKNVHIVVVYR